ncbi:hypothetical protein LX83_003630 [Goodfellowiella coeruleoviolacea]|uniref:Uncharacterized protein n=1 Tax=Goodfellowiella coeruleoviolacea TaxID=334858 RepID=A0AAE3GFH4_9PSEU|nr:hypothetical protein [Goodfellowiella coeruleoviolacea]
MAALAAVVVTTGCAAVGGGTAADGGAAAPVTTEEGSSAPVLEASVTEAGSATTTSTVNPTAVRNSLSRWPSVQDVTTDGTALVVKTSLSITGTAEALAICSIANAATFSTEVKSVSVRASTGEVIAQRTQNDTDCRN